MIIRKARHEDLERIVAFNIQMAMETEGKILDEKVVREGVKSVLYDSLIGFYLVAEEKCNDKILCGQLWLFLSGAIGGTKMFGGYKMYMLIGNSGTKKYSLSFTNLLLKWQHLKKMLLD